MNEAEECLAEPLADNYDSAARFASYWYQIREIRALHCQTVLEVGKGNGVVADYLRRRGIRLTTVDVDSSLSPDLVASVTHLPSPDGAFDIVSCCQVLEHLPYDQFSIALAEIYRVTRKYAVISLPDLLRIYRFLIQLPKIGEIRVLLPVPRLRPIRWQYNGEHYWNINVRDYPLHRIVASIESSGFTVKKRFRVFENPWHHFFVLEKFLGKEPR